jgi:hypothetical protein
MPAPVNVERPGPSSEAGLVARCQGGDREAFDALGDWHLVLRPGLIRTILRGKDQGAADLYYYDLER